MKKSPLTLFFTLLFITTVFAACSSGQRQTEADLNSGLSNESASYPLPTPNLTGTLSVESALANRRSQRSFTEEALSKEALGQLLWAAAGMTSEDNLRTAPSAGALYPLELYAVVGDVTGLAAGIYRYDPIDHQVIHIVTGDQRNALQAAALNQSSIEKAPLTFVFTTVTERLAERYGKRGETRYAYFEIGHAAQNVYLQASSLALGTVAIGAFTDQDVASLLQLPSGEEARYIMPIGHPMH
ncbi:SagB/ThcOx family dehydrogenase [Enterococcus sp. DIV0876]|uniref:SagB/ThcOx family dehydrogenase n=1 Tax=Enterococcus sp. DIV0876 TaxID=2774633 RepID=UPI003D2FEB30